MSIPERPARHPVTVHRRGLPAVVVALLLASTPLSVDAKDCNSKGGLFYLGNTRDEAKSVWLSATSAGSFRLEAAEKSTTVDQWTKSRRGLNITGSPFVSNGNGGTHKLYDTSDNKDCLLDTQNQKGGINLPQLNFPNLKPPSGVLPPIGTLFPNFVTGLMPTLPTRPPGGGGVTPPVGTLPPIRPPTGITPTLPGGVRPPIGVIPNLPTRPPTGITPTLPGGVTPPVGTLPPIRPPTGITPTLPGGVTPPVGTLPPGGVTPPIGTLPPGGVTPPIGTLPPTGITPTLPGGVTPPIGTLPPGGVTPPIGTLPPGGVTPPTGTLPPGGVTPPTGTLPPGGVTPPIGALPPAAGTLPSTVIQPVPVPRYPTEGAILPPDCPDPRTLANQPPGTAVRPDCVPKPQCWPDSCQAGTDGQLDQVPITPGRDLGIGLSKDWNIWTDVRFLSTNDGRYGLDIAGWSRSATAGIDRRIGSNFVLGLSATLEDSKVGGYDGFFSSSSRGWTIGPYAALMLSDNWAVDAALGYSRLNNNYSLAVLDGSYVSQRLTGSANLHGQYNLDFVEVRPRLSFAFVKTYSDGYDMRGGIFGQALSISYPSADYDYSTLEFAVEVNKLFTMANGNKLMPFAEGGVLYEMIRPNGGTILNGDLQPFTPSPWSFSAKAGVRMLISNSILLEARAGYLSFGQAGLDVIEAKLHVSFSF